MTAYTPAGVRAGLCYRPCLAVCVQAWQQAGRRVGGQGMRTGHPDMCRYESQACIWMIICKIYNMPLADTRRHAHTHTRTHAHTHTHVHTHIYIRTHPVMRTQQRFDVTLYHAENVISLSYYQGSIHTPLGQSVSVTIAIPPLHCSSECRTSYWRETHLEWKAVTDT